MRCTSRKGHPSSERLAVSSPGDFVSTGPCSVLVATDPSARGPGSRFPALLLALLLPAITGCIVDPGTGRPMIGDRGDESMTRVVSLEDSPEQPLRPADEELAGLFAPIPRPGETSEDRTFRGSNPEPSSPTVQVNRVSRGARSDEVGIEHSRARVVDVTPVGPAARPTSAFTDLPGSVDDAAPISGTEAEMQALLDELTAFDDTPESDLALTELDRKHHVQGQLLALFRLGHEEVREGLLSSLESLPVKAGRAHLLEIAAFFHRIDRPRLRDRTLALAGEDRARGTRTRGFAIRNVRLCKSARGPGDFVELPGNTVRANRDVVIYGELDALENRPTEEGYATGISVRILILDKSDEIVQRIPITRPGGDRQDHAEPLEEDAVFYYRFRIPDGLLGKYRALVEVTDVHSGEVSTAHLDLRIRN